MVEQKTKGHPVIIGMPFHLYKSVSNFEDD